MMRILCIDDEPDLAVLYQVILERLGHEVLMATSSDEAIAILLSYHVDLIIQDYMRSNMDGGEFLNYIKHDDRLRSIPVAVISSGSRAMRAEQLSELGLDIDRDLVAFIQKPFAIEDLRNLVRSVENAI